MHNFVNANGTYNRTAIFTAAHKAARGGFMGFAYHLRRYWGVARVQRVGLKAVTNALAPVVLAAPRVTPNPHPALNAYAAALYAAQYAPPYGLTVAQAVALVDQQFGLSGYPGSPPWQAANRGAGFPA